MIRFLALVLILTSAALAETPRVNLPPAIRQANRLGPRGTGSCVHASWTMLLRWQGKFETADYWWTHFADGETPNGFASKARNLKVAATFNQNDTAFLEWAIRTRRGCMVTCQNGHHMVLLVHLDKEWAGILDNNAIEGIIWRPREEFLREWYDSQSWAATPLYNPPPPILTKG